MNRTFAWGLSLLSLAILVGMLMISQALPAGDSLALLPESLRRGEWVSHILSNATVPVAMDPVIVFIAQCFGGIELYPCIAAMVFVTGLTGVTRLTVPTLPLSACAALASTFGAALYLTVGNDSILLGSLAWLPLLVASLTLFITSGYIPLGILAVFFALRLERSCGIPSISLFGLAWLWSGQILLTSYRDSEASARRYGFAGTAIFTLGAALLLLRSWPSWPAYPQADASLVPLNGIPGFFRPLIGFDTPLPFINHTAVKTALFTPALIAVCLSLFSFFAIAIARPRGFRAWLVILSVLALALLLDILGSESLAYLSPFNAIARILPGATLLPWSLICLTVAFFIAIVALLEGLPLGLSGVLVGICALGITGYLYRPATPPKPNILVSDIELLSGEPYEHALKIIQSPSLFVARNLGISEVLASHDWIHRAQTPVRDFKAFITVSSRSDLIPLMLDADPATRWSPTKGNQSGNEWILIRFPTPRKIEGLVLDTGSFKSDFPRGLRVSIAANCSEAATSPETFPTPRLSKELNPWLGSLGMTRDGYPFFHAQSDVATTVPPLPLVGCILIEQVGKDPAWDWSVSQLAIATR